MSMPDGDAVNAELQSKPDQPGAPAADVPDVPDHDAAMLAGREAYPPSQRGEMTLPPSPDDGSKHTGPA